MTLRRCKDCKINQNVIEGECKGCDAGLVRDEADPTACVACSSNQIETENGCEAFSDKQVAAATFCASCGAIQFIETSQDDLRFCNDCKLNQNDIENECQECPAGKADSDIESY